MNTHQPLERTYAHHHDGHAHDADEFCVDCFKEDRRRKDLRGALALRGILELGNLAKLRAARSGRRAGDEYSKILDPDRLRSDLFSGDREIRRAALKAKVFIADYLNHRVVLAHPDTNNPALLECLAVITKRTDDWLVEFGREGSVLPFYVN